MPKHEVVVVGGGIAGMRAALAAKEAGAEVALLSKIHPLRTHSGTSQGGINAALRPDDSVDLHASDTVKGGDYLGDQDSVELLTSEAPRAVIELDHWGVPFNRDTNGRLDARALSGTSRPRACYVDELTGHAILQVLYEQLLRAGIRTYEEWVVTRLLLHEGVCHGVVALEVASGQLEAFGAKAVLLATGGCARVYEPTGAAYGVTGDGVSLAYRAGVPLMDMEMVQFHPLGMKGRGVILTDALLGEGGHLLNASGEQFVLKAAPTLGERAPRDIVARAAEEEILGGRGTDGFVSLNLRHLGVDHVKRRFAVTSHLVKTSGGVDLSKEGVPVRPVVHRTIGGIQVRTDGATQVRGLYAVGGCASSGVHGANRLGGNSLLESLVFGRQAGRASADHARAVGWPEGIESGLEDEKRRVAGVVVKPMGSDSTGTVRSELGRLMRQHVGLFRDATGLAETSKRVTELSDRYQRVGVQSKTKHYNYDLIAFLELGSLLTVAEVMVAAARAREESRGAHIRQDHPLRDDARWLSHTLTFSQPGGPRIELRPVTITKWKPEGRRY